MINFKNFITRLLLASAMMLGAGQAIAGPVYHVNINTASVAAAGTGWMDFSFLGLASADATTIKLSNFSGLFGAEIERMGDVADTVAGFNLSNSIDGQAWLTRAVTLGGSFGFNVEFADNFGGLDGVTFAVSLYNEGFDGFLGIDGPLVQFDLVPAFDGAPSAIVVSEDNALATIAEVPEPSQLLLMLTALALLGFMARRART